MTDMKLQMEPGVRIERAGLIIRELAAGDDISICQFANNVDVNKHLDFGSIAQADGAREYVQMAVTQAGEGIADRQHFKFAVAAKDTGELIGSCWLDIEDAVSANATIGYFVAPNHWRRGYATVMVSALTGFAFAELKLHRLFANVDADNTASRRVLEKCGFGLEGTLREHSRRRHGYVDVCYYGLLRKDWQIT